MAAWPVQAAIKTYLVAGVAIVCVTPLTTDGVDMVDHLIGEAVLLVDRRLHQIQLLLLYMEQVEQAAAHLADLSTETAEYLLPA